MSWPATSSKATALSPFRSTFFRRIFRFFYAWPSDPVESSLCCFLGLFRSYRSARRRSCLEVLILLLIGLAAEQEVHALWRPRRMTMKDPQNQKMSFSEQRFISPPPALFSSSYAHSHCEVSYRAPPLRRIRHCAALGWSQARPSELFFSAS